MLSPAEGPATSCRGSIYQQVQGTRWPAPRASPRWAEGVLRVFESDAAHDWAWRSLKALQPLQGLRVLLVAGEDRGALSAQLQCPELAYAGKEGRQGALVAALELDGAAASRGPLLPVPTKFCDLAHRSDRRELLGGRPWPVPGWSRCIRCCACRGATCLGCERHLWAREASICSSGGSARLRLWASVFRRPFARYPLLL